MLGAALSLPLADRAHSSEIANLSSEIESVRAEFSSVRARNGVDRAVAVMIKKYLPE